MAGVEAGNGQELRLSGRIGHWNVGSEVGVINSNPVNDHPNALCQGYHGALWATAAGNRCCLRSQQFRAPAMHHGSCNLTQRAAQIFIACVGDAAPRSHRF